VVGRKKRVQPLSGLKSLLVDSRARSSTPELNADSELFCCAVRACDSALDSAARFDHFLLSICNYAAKSYRRLSVLRRLMFQPRFIDGKRITLAQDNGSLDYVLQLPDVAWPT